MYSMIYGIDRFTNLKIIQSDVIEWRVAESGN